MHAYDTWVQDRRNRARRQDSIRFFATICGVNILAILLTFQLRYGIFGGYDWSRNLSLVVLGGIAVVDTAFVIVPGPTARVVSALLHKSTGAVFTVAATLLLFAVFIVSFPFARTLGRRGFRRRHSASAPWVDRQADWRIPTWHDKTVDIVAVNRRGASPVARALGYFIRQKNFFLFTVALALLMIAAFTVFAQSSPVAPFIYTLF